MSSDIHMHIEVKAAGRNWDHFAAPDMFTDNEFFDYVAGLTDETKAIVPPRGLPADVSFVTTRCWNQDCEDYRPHHAGWLTADELVTLQERLDGDVDPDTWCRPMDQDLEFGYFHTCINGNAVAEHQGWDDVRLVFWFTN